MAFVEATVDGGTVAPALSGTRPAQTPRLWVLASLGYARGPVDARLDLRHEGDRFEDDLNTRPLAAATTLDARLALRLAAAVTLTLDATNLANAFVETGFSGALPERAEPRMLLVGLRFGR
jgi:outer membrane receptor protein involved in Fe transport